MARRSLSKSAEPSYDQGFVIKKYNDVVQSAELLDIRLLSSSFRVEPAYFELKDQNGAVKRKTPQYELKSDLRQSEYNSEEGYLIGHFGWNAGSRHGRRILFSVDATYMIVYKTSRNLEKEYAIAFLKNVGRFAIFPYFRSLTSHYSSASAADFPILPVLKQQIDSADGDNPGSDAQSETEAAVTDQD